MKIHVRHISLAGCLLLITTIAHAQHDERIWAVSYSGSPLVKQVLTSNPSNHSLGRGFRAFSLMGEYFLPKKWSAEAGYFRTEVSYGGNSRTMEGLQLGMRRYFLPAGFFLQPYVVATTQLNWGRHIEKSYVLRENYLNSQYTRNPRISFAPGVGLEFFLFSSIGFIVRYSYNMGFNSKTIIDVRSESGASYSLKDRGLYHQLELGVKVTFPFRITKDEQQALVNGLLNSLLD